MLTQHERDTFRLALAAYNCLNTKQVSELDIDDMLDDRDIVETSETVVNFIEARGRIFEEYETPFGTVYEWRNIQSRKNARRGNLYVMHFEEARAAYFTGE